MFGIQMGLDSNVLIACDETPQEVLEYELGGLLESIRAIFDDTEIQVNVCNAQITVDFTYSELQPTLKEFKEKLREVFTRFGAEVLGDLTFPVTVTEL